MYVGRIRRIRLDRAEKRFEPPMWRTFIHPMLVAAVLIKDAHPELEFITLPDERCN